MPPWISLTMPKPITQTRSFQHLLTLSPPPISELISPERFQTHCIKSKEVSFNYACTALTDEIIAILSDLCEEQGLIEHYQSILNGDPVNLSENRAVNHHRYRAKIPSSYTQELDRCKTVALDIRKQGIENQAISHIIQIGIGGSELGPRAVYDSLRVNKTDYIPITFLANVDPTQHRNHLKNIDFSSSMIVVVSKSGATLETQATLELVKEAAQKSGLSDAQIQKRLYGITCKGSPLDDQIDSSNCFYIDETIGGRFSSSSPVAAFSLYLSLGATPFDEFLLGAQAMDVHSLEPRLRYNLPMMMAAIAMYDHSVSNLPIRIIAAYHDFLSAFTEHLQQVDCESLGKSLDRENQALNINSGALLVPAIGTNTQHSFFQLLHQGTVPFSAQFIASKSVLDAPSPKEEINFGHSLSNCIAQQIAFAIGDPTSPKAFPGNIRSTCLILEDASPKHIGALWSAYEQSVLFQAALLNLNAYDQPGVSLGKSLAQSFSKPSRSDLLSAAASILNI